MKHEGIHVGQWERHGFTFPYRYGWELVTEGYGCQIRYEEAAYKGAGQACPG